MLRRKIALMSFMDLTFCTFVSQLGYLLAIPRTPEMKEEQDFAIDGLEFVVDMSLHAAYANELMLWVLPLSTKC